MEQPDSGGGGGEVGALRQQLQQAQQQAWQAQDALREVRMPFQNGGLLFENRTAGAV